MNYGNDGVLKINWKKNRPDGEGVFTYKNQNFKVNYN